MDLRWPERQEFIDPAVRPDMELFQNILEPGIGLKAIQLGGRQQTLNGGRPTPCAFRPSEEPISAPERNRPNRILDRVVVDRGIASRNIAPDGQPPLERVVDCSRQSAAIGRSESLSFQPAMERQEAWQSLALA